MFWSLAVLAAAILAGSAVYVLLSLLAALRYRAQRIPAPAQARVPVSILKPLHGLDEGLEENLRSFFAQPYRHADGSPAFEILFATRDLDDPALAVVAKLREEFPDVPVSRLLTGEPPYPNAKVYSLALMVDAARHDLLVMADSDVRVDARFLETISAEFTDPALGLSTCPYRAVAGASFWSFLEALHMNTEFLGGVLTARLLEGVRFALGPTITIRRGVLDDIGGFAELREFLAEDFVMGQRAAARGHRVILSRYAIEHRIGSQDLVHSMAHRLRWARSTRRSRPAGYFGELFLRPLGLAVLLTVVAPPLWPILPATLLLRYLQADVLRRTVRARFGWKHWALLPAQDLLSFAIWLAGFFGSTILWRGHRYRLEADGRFTRIP
ncbi:MAG: bacteriohopanetetrol glucosamine biosynthesis glycosyltransferase HpnI [Bryobacterales bacterium]|nr:bacteriohopanetetrol glucosamine biosynthesis glycosyltransferase HpnI [Bryobacterales bacterium]